MKIYELLAKPEAWTKYECAKTEDGYPCSALSERAVCFCVWGAIDRCYPKIKDWMNVYERIRQELKVEAVGKWNDLPTTTHEMVLDLCKKLDV